MYCSSVIPGAVCSVNSSSGWVISGSGSDSASDSSSSHRSTNGGFCLVSHLFWHQKMLSPTDSEIFHELLFEVSHGAFSWVNFCLLLLS